MKMAVLTLLFISLFTLAVTACPHSETINKPTSAPTIKQDFLEAPEFILKGIGLTLQKDPHTLQESDLQKVDSLNLTEEMLSESERKSNSSFDLSLIIKMSNLKYLVIRHIPTSNYSFLEKIDHLEFLEITGFKFSEIPLEHLPENLFYLSLIEGDITQLEPLKPIAQRITSLSIQKNPLSNISNIGMFSNLTFLDLSGDPIKDLSPVTDLQNLTRIQLRETGISNLAPLKSLLKLRYVDVRDTPVTSVSALIGLHDLRILLIDKSKVSDVNLLSANKELQISSTAILG
jgi:internalin A